jgi:predicted metal-dependent HD superfamily phosphohydrolase
MLNRFRELWRRCGAKSEADIFYKDIQKSYSEPHRFYHTLNHIDYCLKQLDSFFGNTGDSNIVEFALWYHDFVYNPLSNNNEEESANAATLVCHESEMSVSFTNKVHELILITKHSKEPSDFLQKVIIDIDLSILGSNLKSYDSFETNIRKEYSPVNDRDFLMGRTNILKGFLNRPRIFYTDFFFGKYHEAARNNLMRTIKNFERSMLKLK